MPRGADGPDEKGSVTATAPGEFRNPGRDTGIKLISNWATVAILGLGESRKKGVEKLQIEGPILGLLRRRLDIEESTTSTPPISAN